ncbi:MAG TPA: trehalase family glycosidase [Acetobacteraceae bacterium]|nr:trehalase family glycosidase [Acetobacteraceae bacterium]
MNGASSSELASFSVPQWHGGQLMAYSGIDGPTHYETGLIIRTVANHSGIEIVYPARSLVVFGRQPETEIIVSNDFFSFRDEAGQATRGCLLDAHHLLISGPATTTDVSDTIRSLSEGDRCLIGAASHFDPALIRTDLEASWRQRSRWIHDQPILKRFSGSTRKTLFRALSVMKGQLSAPEGAIHSPWTTPDRWPHKDMWLWDSVFHAIGWRHIDPMLARAALDAVFEFQRPDGFIPHQMSPTRNPSEYTQPPVLAYGVALVNEVLGDPEWPLRLYPKLAAYIRWDMENRDKDGDGLVEWFVEGDPASRSGESGMDNSPRFDFHYPTRLAAVDFNSYLARECEVMATLAQKLGYEKDAASWQEKHERLCQRINHRLWSEKDQFYCDYDAANDARSPILASVGFLPLICGAASPERAAALARHLLDPEMFATAFPVPSIAVRDREHYSKDMWRGPTWVNVNWLIARGLERYAHHDEHFAELAHALDTITIQRVEQACETFGTFFEYFDDRWEVPPPHLLRKGICSPDNPLRRVIHDYGWTTTLYVDLVSRQDRSPDRPGPDSRSVS